MRLRIAHTTHYRYPVAAVESHNEVRLMPLDDADQRLLDFHLHTAPAANVYHYSEPGGVVHQFNVRPPHSDLVVEMTAEVETLRRDPFAGVNLTADDWGRYAAREVASDYAEYLAPTALAPHIPAVYQIAEVARKHVETPSVAAYVLALNHRLHRLLEYQPGATAVHTPLDRFLAQRKGVCQDFAHTMLAVCRSQSIPTRYVSGYLCGPDGGTGARAESATHAWVECLLFDLDGRPAWRGFDPTNDVAADDKYVKAHVGRDSLGVTPLKGIYRGPAEHTMDVSVTVARLAI
jgi:transglutaminase-like putative cysteine protease